MYCLVKCHLFILACYLADNFKSYAFYSIRISPAIQKLWPKTVLKIHTFLVTIFSQPISIFWTHYAKIVHYCIPNKFSPVQKQYFNAYLALLFDLNVFINPSSPYDVIVSHQHLFITTEMFQRGQSLNTFAVISLKLLETFLFCKKCLMLECIFWNISKVIFLVRLAIKRVCK